MGAGLSRWKGRKRLEIRADLPSPGAPAWLKGWQRRAGERIAGLGSEQERQRVSRRCCRVLWRERSHRCIWSIRLLSNLHARPGQGGRFCSATRGEELSQQQGTNSPPAVAGACGAALPPPAPCRGQPPAAAGCARWWPVCGTAAVQLCGHGHAPQHGDVQDDKVVT